MADSTPMLFAPPRAPLRLDAGEEIVVGRLPECDITVSSAKASRRHAIFRLDGDSVSVEDLGSTNGTFRNGDAVSGRVTLSPGDRIEVGDVQVTYCLVESAPATATHAGDQTIIALDGPEAAAAPSQALEGDLAKIPIFAVLQMLEMGGQNGCLRVESGASLAAWIQGGRVVHAETEKHRGLDAALEMALATDGRFAFSPDETPPENSFEASVTEIILESSRLFDEANA